MSILDIPQDLYDYFPLELGTTCRQFNSKINIYNRTIVVKGDVWVDYIKFDLIKKVDLSCLKPYQVQILMTRIDPRVLYLGDDIELPKKFGKKLRELHVETIHIYQNNNPYWKKLNDKNIKVYAKELIVLVNNVRPVKNIEHIKSDSIALYSIFENLTDVIDNTKNIRSISTKLKSFIKFGSKYPDKTITIYYRNIFKLENHLNILNNIVIIEDVPTGETSIPDKGLLREYIDKGKIILRFLPERKIPKSKSDEDHYFSDDDKDDLTKIPTKNQFPILPGVGWFGNPNVGLVNLPNPLVFGNTSNPINNINHLIGSVGDAILERYRQEDYGDYEDSEDQQEEEDG